MTRSLLPAPTLVLVTCTAPVERRHDAVMDLVEARIRLPSGAGVLAG